MVNTVYVHECIYLRHLTHHRFGTSVYEQICGLGKMLVLLETDTALISKNDDDDDDEKNIALHSKLKVTTQQHFSCTVKHYELLHKCDVKENID